MNVFKRIYRWFVPEPPPKPIVYSMLTEDVCRYTGLKKGKVYQLRANGIFDAEKRGKRYYYNKKSIDDYLEVLAMQ